MQQLGPVLQFLGSQNNAWGISALVVVDAADAEPQFTLTGTQAALQPAVNKTFCPVPGQPCVAWRFDFAVPQTVGPQVVTFKVGDQSQSQSYSFNVPARGAMPSLAYASCNGFSSASAMKSTPVPNALWARLQRLHTLVDKVDTQTFGPYHLLLLGGDQVYSDAMWAVLPELKAWAELDHHTRINAPFTPSLQAAVAAYFSKIYLERWSQPDVAAALASVPAVMMWDDHDIMDGWGSHPAELHECPVFQGIFSVAKAAFELFQRHIMQPGAHAPATLPGQSAHNSGYRMGAAGLLALDMRSERSPRSGDVTSGGGVLHAEQVMSENSWRAVYQWLDAQEAAGDLKHLFVMSSIPVVHPSFEVLEKMLGIFPGQQSLEDDLRDHWTSPPHKAERLRLVHRLMAASAKGIRITLLSGDVHVAAVGVIESDRSSASANGRVINQLTSSGIVHPPPPGVALLFLEQACQRVDTIDRGITGTMHEFPTTNHRMIGARNFLTLQPDGINPNGLGQERYWANWWAEGEPHPYTKVIHPVG